MLFIIGRILDTTFIIEEKKLQFGLTFMVLSILFVIVVAKTLRSMVSGLGWRKMTEGNLGTIGKSGDIS